MQYSVAALTQIEAMERMMVRSKRDWLDIAGASCAGRT
jgi:hypothetical protein